MAESAKIVQNATAHMAGGVFRGPTQVIATNNITKGARTKCELQKVTQILLLLEFAESCTYS